MVDTRVIWMGVAAAMLMSQPVLAQEEGDVGGEAQGEVSAETSGSAQAGGSAEAGGNPELGLGVPGGEQQTPRARTQTGGGGGAAVDQAIGKWGAGYFTTSAPFGVRRWVDETFGWDAGLGFNVATSDPSVWGLGMEGGVLFPLVRYENLIVFGRGGLGIGLTDPGPGDVNFNLNVNGTLGGEFFMTALGFPNLSFSGGLRLQADFNKPDNGDFVFQLATDAPNVNVLTAAVLGFHIYI